MSYHIEIAYSGLLAKLRGTAPFNYLKKATAGSAGFDLMAAIEKDMVIKSGQSKLVPTGVFIKMPPSLVADVRPRSGLALKHGLTVLNTPGTIDSDYRGEVGVIIINHGPTDATITPLMRIAQLVFLPVPEVTLSTVAELSPDNDKTGERGKGGFGSTGSSHQ